MRLSEKILGVVLLVGLFCFIGVVFGADSATIDDPLGVGDFGTLFANIAKAVSGIVAGIATIALIISGIMFLFSGGSPDKINTAKRALVYAIIGIVVGLSVGAIIDFVKQTVGSQK